MSFLSSPTPQDTNSQSQDTGPPAIDAEDEEISLKTDAHEQEEIHQSPDLPLCSPKGLVTEHIEEDEHTH